MEETNGPAEAHPQTNKRPGWKLTNSEAKRANSVTYTLHRRDLLGMPSGILINISTALYM